MNKKNIFTGLGLLLIFIISFFAFLSFFSEQTAHDIERKTLLVEHCEQKNTDDDGCSQIQINYPHYANNETLNSFVETLMQSYFITNEAQSLPNTISEFEAFLKNYLKQQIQAIKKEYPKNSESWKSVLHISIHNVAQNGDFLSFQYFYDNYQAGMAHGAIGGSNTVLNTKTNRVVNFEDILLNKSAEKALFELQKAKWIEMQEFSPEDIKEHFELWPFVLSTDWYFGKNSLIFSYDSYEICPYACGLPEIELSADQLKGIIRPEILQAAAHWEEIERLEQEEETQ